MLLRVLSQGLGGAGLKQLVDVTGRRREFHFYVSSRLDGLRHRFEDVERKVGLGEGGFDDSVRASHCLGLGLA